jgi:glycosyltransferase involved in cell wall biosynthesis
LISGISVIVCCYNSAKRLPQTLAYLAQQVVPSDIPWEVIVVDNASTDNTAVVAKEEWAKYGISDVQLSVVFQPKPGLTYAREMGISEAKYDVLLFCDDDNWLCAQYIQIAFEVMEGNDCIGAIGGEGVVKSNEQLPDWFEEYKGYFACYPQGDRTGELSNSNAFLYGAGLIVRKAAIDHLDSCGVKFLLADRSGESLLSGGDTELSYLLRLLNYKLWYDDRLKFYHFMPSQRLTYEYLQKLITAMSYSNMKLIIYDYVLSNKPVNRFTWLVDVGYRFYFLIKSVIKAPFINSQFIRRVDISSSWNSLKAIFSLFGKYRKFFDSICELKSIDKRNMSKSKNG